MKVENDIRQLNIKQLQQKGITNPKKLQLYRANIMKAQRMLQTSQDYHLSDFLTFWIQALHGVHVLLI